MTEPTHAYIFLRPCGHLALVIADSPRVLSDYAASIIENAVHDGLTMKRITAEEVRTGPYRFCPPGCTGKGSASPLFEDESCQA